MGGPVRLNIRTNGAASQQRIDANEAYCASLGIPYAQPCPLHGRALAVVGGGPSVQLHLEELRLWDGDIWAINAMASWLAKRGIKATMFSVDALEGPAGMCDGVESALLANRCHTTVFDALRGKDINVFAVDGEAKEGQIKVFGYCTSASRTQVLAPILGYGDVTYFGCEGSYEGSDHVDRHEDRECLMLIDAGGKRYTTYPELMLQSEFLSACIREFPIFKEKSGGLLRAMIEYPDDWSVVAVSGPMLQLRAASEPNLIAEKWQPQTT